MLQGVRRAGFRLELDDAGGDVALIWVFVWFFWKKGLLIGASERLKKWKT